MEKLNEQVKRLFAVFLSVCLIWMSVPVTASAEGERAVDGLCPHHTEHTAECGYTSAVGGSECTHIHDERCGYAEAADCAHTHDGNCGYAEASACTHKHTEACGEDGSACVHNHDENCGYAEASACAHTTHDDSCGYKAASECTHIHDENCGYAAASSGNVCNYVCKICEVQALIDALPSAEEITEERCEELAEQLDEIDRVKAELADEEIEQLDVEKYEMAVEKLQELAGEQETAEKISPLSDSGGPITWTMDGDTMTIRGEGSRQELRGDFWTALGSANKIKFVDCKITGSMEKFFQGSTAGSIDCSGLDTSGVTDMRGMFISCIGVTSLNLSGSFNTDNVTDMSSMFGACKSLTNLNLSNFNTSNVTNMSSMFMGSNRLTSLDLSSFDTSKVCSMRSMFFGCSGLTNLKVSGFDTSKVTEMYSMFIGCSSLTSLDLSRWNTGRVTSMKEMFDGCSSLTSLNVSGFNTGRVTSMEEMFSGCSSLTSLDLSRWNTGNVTSMEGMFSGCSSLTSLNVSNFNTGNVTNMVLMFGGCKGLASLDVSNFNTSKVTGMGGMFSGCSSLTSLSLNNFDTSSVENMSSIFESCSGMKSLDVSNFNTSRVTGMHWMFWNCSSLTSLNLSNFDTSNVTSMHWMFSGCSGLTSLDLSGWNTGKVNYMANMFSGCSGLTSLDLSGFDMSKAVNPAGPLEPYKGTVDMLSSTRLTILKTPFALGDSIDLPYIYVDPDGRETRQMTRDFLSTTLTRKGFVPQYTLTGTITGHRGVAYASVSAKLVALNGTIYPAEVTGGDSLNGTTKNECTYSVTAPAGQYSLEVVATTTAGVTVNRSAVVKLSGDGQTKNINLPNGQAKVNVNANNNKKVLVGGLDSLILKNDDSIIDNAAAAEVTFTANSADDTEAAAKIQASDPAQNMEFYDFSITKKVDGSESSVTDTGDAPVTIVIPFDKKGKGNVKVYRYHGGDVDTLTEQEADGEKIEVGTDSITIYAKKFSVYAVGYTVSANSSTSSSSTDNASGSMASANASSSGNSDDSPTAAQPAAGAEKVKAFWKPLEVNWQNVLSQANAAQNGGHINVITGAAFSVPNAVIQILSGTDKALALHLGKGTAVSIYGKNILNNNTAFGLAFTETADIPNTAKRDVVQGAAAVREFTIAPGAVPFPVNLHFALGAENAGKTACLYRYDANSKKLSAVEQFRITAGGHAMFILKEGGSYLLIVSSNAANEAYIEERQKITPKKAAKNQK